ncbi:MAG: zf-HC2 domain-containing protein [Mycobacterium leprae]
MSIPKELPCHLAQDLLIPYVAGDVSTETREWLEEHLRSCNACRAAYEATNRSADAVSAPPPAPVGDPGRRVLGRMRRNIFVVVAAVLVAVGLGGGALFWGIQALRNVAGMPAYHPAPVDGIQPIDVVQKLDLSDLGMNKQLAEGRAIRVNPPAKAQQSLVIQSPQIMIMPGVLLAGSPGQADAGVQQEAFFLFNGQPVLVYAFRADTAKAAHDALQKWHGTFHVFIAEFQFDRPDESAMRFRSGDWSYYAWSRGNWAFVIEVPASLPDQATVRDQVRDRLIRTIQELNGAKGP